MAYGTYRSRKEMLRAAKKNYPSSQPGSVQIGGVTLYRPIRQPALHTKSTRRPNVGPYVATKLVKVPKRFHSVSSTAFVRRRDLPPAVPAISETIQVTGLNNRSVRAAKRRGLKGRAIKSAMY